MNKIIIATNNKHKLKEFKEMLEPIGFNVLSLSDVGFNKDIVEDGLTFKENSYIKAKTIFDEYNIPTIGDDSGLIVDILNGPGIHSHRYAGDNATDKDNRNKLIKELSRYDDEYFDAHFTTALTYYSKDRVIQEEGYLYGKVIKEERGENGFGYDPIFYLSDYFKTVSELSSDVKNSLSHRHNALVKLIEDLK